MRTSLFLPCMLVSVSLFFGFIFTGAVSFHLLKPDITVRGRLSAENLLHLSAGRSIIIR